MAPKPRKYECIGGPLNGQYRALDATDADTYALVERGGVRIGPALYYAAPVAGLAAKMDRHVQHLARGHGVALTFKPGASARSYRRERKLVLQPVRGRATYYVALHEFGHVLGPNPPRRLEQEVAAWRWALAHAVVPPTPGVWKMIARVLVGYEARAKRRANMQLPPPDHDYWALLEEAHLGADG